MASIIQMPSHVKRQPVDLYPRMNFPMYEFVEFPQWVTAPDGWQPAGGEMLDKSDAGKVKVLCADEDEKRRVLEGVAPASAEVDERTELLALADRKGILADKRWSIDTLRSKVA